MDAYQCKNCFYWRASRGKLVHSSTVKCPYCGVKGQWHSPPTKYQCEKCQHRRDSVQFTRTSRVKCSKCGTVGKWQIVTSAVDASRTDLAMYLFHTDLCIQAYQFYAQSLVWPLDPWYDRLARGLASRRDNMMAELYAVFGDNKANMKPVLRSGGTGNRLVRGGKPKGPKAAKGSSFLYRSFDDHILVDVGLRGPGSAHDPKAPVDKKLDPILTRYHQIKPGKPAFQYERDGRWTVFRFKGPITDQIKDVYFCEYTKKNADNPFGGATEIKKLDYVGGGSDVLYGFEGATGKTKDRKYPNWSMMGYVLSRNRGGVHDVHVVFRGSRSARLARAATKAVVQTKGNPDWVTDTTLHRDKMPLISTEGQIHRGFGLAITSALGTIRAVFDKINTDRGKPDRIFVTGHSLGAALATAFASAVRCGEFGTKKLSSGVKLWPWENLMLLPISSPAIGNRDFRDWFHEKVKNIHRFYVAGDVVTTLGTNKHVGNKIEFKRRDKEMDPHEPMSVRESLEVRYKRTTGASAWDYNERSPRFHPPMLAVKGGFQDMMDKAKPKEFDLLPQDLFPPHTQQDTVFFIRVLQRALSYSSSYKAFITGSEAQKRRDVLEKFFHTDDWDECKKAIENGLFDEFKEAQGDLGPYLSLLYAALIVKEHGGGKKDLFNEIREINRAAHNVYHHSGSH